MGDAILFSALVGLIVSKKYLGCHSFSVYIAAVWISTTMIWLWPDRFHAPEFWLVKETIHSLLKFSIALELTARTVQAFPGARATARSVIFTVLAFTYLGVVAVPVGNAEYATIASEILPRILNGTIWLFTAIAALILWYRLPVDPLHKAILIGFVPYLLVFTVGLNAVHSFGWDLLDYTGFAQSTAYNLLILYWNYAIWRRPEPALATAPSRVQQPA